MKHKYIKSHLNPLVCILCKRTEVMHSDLAECESCGQTGPVEVFKNQQIALCANCYDREANTVVPAKVEPTLQLNEVKVDEVVVMAEEIDKDDNPTTLENEALNRMGSNSIKTTMDYFNARTMAIVSLKAEIEKDETVVDKRFELARNVRDHFKHMRKVLFEAMEVQLQCASEQRADQAYLNTLANQLSKEAKAELHLESPNYEPKKAPTNVSYKPKQTKFEKQLESYANALKIPVEQARRALEAGLKKQGYICTCKETPGVCKVHV